MCPFLTVSLCVSPPLTQCITGSRLGFWLELAATLLAPILCFIGLTLLVATIDLIDRKLGVRAPLPTWKEYRKLIRRKLHDPKCYKMLVRFHSPLHSLLHSPLHSPLHGPIHRCAISHRP